MVVRGSYIVQKRWISWSQLILPAVMSLNSLMDVLFFIAVTSGLGILCSIPGILIGHFLAAKGIAPDQSRWVVMSSILGLLITRLMMPDVPLIYIVITFSILAPLGLYRHDLWTTFRSGRWWWLKPSNERQPLFNLLISGILSLGIVVVLGILVLGIWILIANLLS